MFNERNAKMTKVLMVACGLCAASAWAAWDPGEPVVTYWFGPGCPGKAEKRQKARHVLPELAVGCWWLIVEH